MRMTKLTTYLPFFFPILFVLIGCGAPSESGIPAACKHYIRSGKLEVETFYHLSMAAYASDSNSRAPRPTFSITPYRDKVDPNLFLWVELATDSFPGAPDNSHLEVSFGGEEEAVKLYPLEVIQTSRINYTLCVSVSTESMEFEKLQRKPASSISLYFNEHLVVHSLNHLDYFHRLLPCALHWRLWPWFQPFRPYPCAAS